MIRLIRFLSSSLCLGLLTLTLTLAIPAIAKPPQIATIESVSNNNIQNLVHRGQVAYDLGRYQDAVIAWQQAEQVYQRYKERVNRASNLNHLALAYQELGQLKAAEKSNAQSLQLLQTQSESNGNLAIIAQALNIKGSLQLAMGKAKSALETWQEAASTYQQAQDSLGIIGSQINQAQALQAMGFHRRSHKLLLQIQEQLSQESNPLLKVKVLNSFGTTLQTIGDLNLSQEVLESSLAISRDLNLLEEQAITLFSLGNTAKLKEDDREAIAFYQQAVALTKQPLTKIEAQLNLLSSLIATEQVSEAKALLPKIKTNIVNLPLSRSAIYTQVNLAKNLSDLQTKESVLGQYTLEITDILAQAKKKARQIQDNRAESAAWGTLGHFYEQQQQWNKAEKTTLKALNLAQLSDAVDLSYQWQWQLGRLLKTKKNHLQAIAYYTEAVNNLQSLRSSLVAVSSEAQFSFRKSVEPVYRELVSLLLADNPNQAQLQQAREVIESLQLAELENFFHEACLDAQPKQVDEVDATAAVIYPIILPDRLEVILSLPDGSLRHYSTDLPQTEIEKTIADLYQSLNPFFSNKQRMQLSQQVYDWTIAPAEADLDRLGIETLAFVLDGKLRNLPMSALHDGERYAIEKYNIALTPGLQLLPSPGLAPNKLEAIVAGVSESNQGFSALPGVREEVTQITSLLSSKLLLNEEFTDANFQEKLQNSDAPIVHLATHGQFSSTLEDTFIVIWQDRVQVNELESLLRTRETSRIKPIELMVLSACQTATGDERAALGMAGMAVRSGARSTVATLWSVKDKSTTRLIDEFYQQLIQPQSINKAEALRNAQIALIKSQDFNHPFYWSPFVLVGNWL